MRIRINNIEIPSPNKRLQLHRRSPPGRHTAAPRHHPHNPNSNNSDLMHGILHLQTILTTPHPSRPQQEIAQMAQTIPAAQRGTASDNKLNTNLPASKIGSHGRSLSQEADGDQRLNQARSTKEQPRERAIHSRAPMKKRTWPKGRPSGNLTGYWRGSVRARARRGARGVENSSSLYKLACLMYYMYSCTCVIYRAQFSLKSVHILVFLILDESSYS